MVLQAHLVSGSKMALGYKCYLVVYNVLNTSKKRVVDLT